MFAVKEIRTEREIVKVLGGERISQTQTIEILCNTLALVGFAVPMQILNLTYENTDFYSLSALSLSQNADMFLGVYNVVRYKCRNCLGVGVLHITVSRRQQLPVRFELCKNCKYHFGKMQIQCGVYPYKPDNVENCSDFQEFQ